MRFIGNVLWFVFGGALLAILWAGAGVLCTITIIGIPVGVQCFKFAGYVLWPFGRSVEYNGRVGSFLLNVIWILLLGWELAVVSLAVGILWCITIIGIPFGLQFIKFAQLAIMPFGARVVTNP